MKTPRARFALVALFILAAQSFAADLTKVERKIAKEPEYRSQRVKYCLLVFGAEARTHVWLAQDGDILYIDRNGNGDLTDEGEKVAAKASTATNPEEEFLHFEAGDISDGPLTHRDLRIYVWKLERFAANDDEISAHVAKHPQAQAYRLYADIEIPGLKGSGLGGRVQQMVDYRDANGILEFSDAAKEAPVVHFGGPRQVMLWGRQRVTAGRETELYLCIGTPGVGEGTTAYFCYEGGVPKEAYAVALITYPPQQEGEAPIVRSYTLERRC